MSPLAFESEEMYRYEYQTKQGVFVNLTMFRFISLRLESQYPDDQKEVVIWLQTLCHLGVIIPLEILFTTYSTALR